MSDSQRKDIVSKLTSLGCAYSVAPSKEIADLEKTILQCLKYYWISNDVIFMLYGLLKYRLGHLVHVERLIILAKKEKLTDDELIVLLALSEKLMENGDERYEAVIRKLKRKGLKMSSPPKSETDSYLIERWGLDTNLEKYGVNVRLWSAEPEKKFLTMRGIFKINPWLALRALVGPNNRADILYLKLNQIVPTANQAMSYLGCSKDAAYRHWNATENVESLKIVVRAD